MIFEALGPALRASYLGEKVPEKFVLFALFRMVDVIGCLLKVRVNEVANISLLALQI